MEFFPLGIKQKGLIKSLYIIGSECPEFAVWEEEK